MSQARDVTRIAAGLRVSIGLLRRQLRQQHAEGELSLPETAALARLDRLGPTTTAALARSEQISPQAMGVTIAKLEKAGLINRDADPGDGRQVVNSATEAGLRVLHDQRNLWTEAMAKALARDFTDDELEQLQVAVPLIERLAQRLALLLPPNYRPGTLRMRASPRPPQQRPAPATPAPMTDHPASRVNSPQHRRLRCRSLTVGPWSPRIERPNELRLTESVPVQECRYCGHTVRRKRV